MKASTWMPVLQALAAGTPLSGGTLGAQLGLTRAAIWQRVQYLMQLGVPISTSRAGYCADVPLYLPDPAVLAAKLTHPIECVAEVDSTNTLLMQHGACDRTVLAIYQNSGRGRRSRTWLGAPGLCLMGSVARVIAVPDCGMNMLPIAVGVQICQYFNRLGVPARLKWPNDLWVGERKLAGFLCEVSGDLQDRAYVVVGLGLNLNRSENTPEIATTWAAHTTGPWGDWQTIGAIETIEAALTSTLNTDPSALQAAYSEVSLIEGRRVTITTAGKVLEGIARGIDTSGRLQVLTETGLQVVSAGDVSVRPQ
jgi:BirA family biotin operon repressor/biotin-[acetyl-CoA-carboxylase] ligase